MTNADLLNGFAAAISAAMATAYIVLAVPAARPFLSRIWRP
ncbi:hypothetical protein R1A27_20340 [Methylobacterium sp. NMS12]